MSVNISIDPSPLSIYLSTYLSRGRPDLGIYNSIPIYPSDHYRSIFHCILGGLAPRLGWIVNPLVSEPPGLWSGRASLSLKYVNYLGFQSVGKYLQFKGQIVQMLLRLLS